MNEKVKTGTTTVALVCKDGVVLGADKRATAGYVANKKILKIQKITENAAVTTAGAVSVIQLIAKYIRAEIRLKNLHVDRETKTKEIANMVSSMQFSMLRSGAYASFLLGGFDNEGASAYECEFDGTLMAIEDYATTGSGSMFALGVLEELYKPNMTVEEGMKVVQKALNAAMQRDIYSGNGIDVMTITKKGAQYVLHKEVNVGLQ